eukprot:13823756-Alexandrium_andersonii.AAC.1
MFTLPPALPSNDLAAVMRAPDAGENSLGTPWGVGMAAPAPATGELVCCLLSARPGWLSLCADGPALARATKVASAR